MPFNEIEKKILAAAQDNIPASLEPFADLARNCGASEDEVLGLLRDLKARGVIRRFGASIRHTRAGWTRNVMTAWKATEAEADRAGQAAAKHPRVSHAYYRPSPSPDWPYSFYAMIHGRDDEDCAKTIAELAAESGLSEPAALPSLRELKKTSMKYFVE